MKKVFGSLAVLALVAGCSSEPKNATNLGAVSDYINSGVCQLVATGAQNDIVLKCAPNEIFDTVFAADKSAKVLSAEFDIAAALADTAFVYVNIVPDETCPVRVLVPGSNIDDMYAVQVCAEPVAAPAEEATAEVVEEVATEAPVAE